MSKEVSKDFYSKAYAKGNIYYKEEIVKTGYRITILMGEANVIAVGANGNFMFIFEEILYQTCSIHESIARTRSVDENSIPDYINYGLITFDKDISKEWSSLYNRNVNDGEYWKAV